MIPLEPPYVPAISEAATEFFESILEPHMTAFEWGSGGSTVWLAQRVAQVVTVENLPAWQAEVKKYADEEGLDNVQFLLFHWEKGQPHRDEMLALYCRSILGFPNSHFDIVFSDGWDISRKDCGPLAVSKVKPGGWLVADDVHWNPAKWSVRPVRDAGWHEKRKGGPVMCGWDGQGRRTVTGFFRKPS